MLWRELPTMDFFFTLDPINEFLYETFISLSEKPFSLKADAVKVFNEVYYQVTRMVYEHPMPSDLQFYVSDVKGNLGWNYSAELVMSMAYQIISLMEHKTRPLNKFFTKTISATYGGSIYWGPFKRCFVALKKKKVTTSHDFLPRPIMADELRAMFVRWSVITNNYDLGAIEHVLNLWSTMADKRAVATMIRVSARQFVDDEKMDQLLRFFSQYLVPEPFENQEEYDCCMEPLSTVIQYEDEIAQLRKENNDLKSRIAELELDNERLASMKRDDAAAGGDKHFPLTLLVEYCKNRVRWEDVKDIVAMLNFLMRGECTKEQSAMVDGVEEEFKKRIMGNQYINPNITMQQPHFEGSVYDLHDNDNVKIGS